MNFKITKNKMLQVMNHISKVLAITVILPIYKGVKIVTDQNGMRIIASDGTVSMMEYVSEEIQVLEFGECVVDGKLLHEIIKKANDGMIWMRKENNQMKIRSGKAEMKLVIFSDDQYPKIDFDFPDSYFKTNANMLNDAIEKTIFSANDQQTRPVLGGIHFKISEGKCYVTATDSYRLSHKCISVNCEDEMSITIPKKMLTLLSMLYAGEEELFVYFSKRKALMSNDNIIIQSVLLEGTFPDYKSLIPVTFESEIKIPSSVMLEALDRTSFIKDEGITTVCFELLNDEIMLTCENRQVGSSIESIPFEAVTGNKKVKFYCNQTYILDALKALKSEFCILKYNGDMKPFVLQSDEIDHVQLLLPVRHQ